MEATTDKVIYRYGVTALAAIVVCMIGVSLWGAMALPPGNHYAVHWDINGNPNGFGSKFELLWLMPLIGAVITPILAILPLFEPRREHIRRSMKAYMAISVSALVLLLLVHVAAVLIALGAHLNMLRIIGVLMGLLFMVIGNYLGKLRSNFFAGIRTPWTLSSELSWNKTHRLSGKLFFLFGFLLLIAGIVASPMFMIVVIVALIPTMLIVTFGYSYIVWKHDPARAPGNGRT